MQPSWQPSADLDVLKQRAALLATARDFFAQRDVLEVQTPVLATAGNPDPHIDSVPADVSAGGFDVPHAWLNTSPEFCMKRLLAAGSGDIYQLCPAFRAGESGRWHNPEFTILEWYRLGFDMHQLMAEVAELVTALTGKPLTRGYKTWADAWADEGLDANNATALTQQLNAAAIDVPKGLSLAALQDLAFSYLVQPALGQHGLCFVYHYPAEQASLARLDKNDSSVAKRFELFWQGVELANGFVELADAVEQAERFAADNQQREAEGKPLMPQDTKLLAALEKGLPDCAGVAVGFDRLAALALGQTQLDQVMSFNASRS